MLPPWVVHRGHGPVLATAIHEGHELSEGRRSGMGLDDVARRREEDPYTLHWTAFAPNRIVVLRSRFEVDLNRPREGAVYRTPDDAWGLPVWDGAADPAVVEDALALYDRFYDELHTLLTGLVERWGRFVVYDIHSYNHRRGGPDAPPADPDGNPDVNLGTGHLDGERWGDVAESFIRSMIEASGLDVRENVRFTGGHLARWVGERFPKTGCCLAVELKKFYMDEWSGAADMRAVHRIRRALTRTVPSVLASLHAA